MKKILAAAAVAASIIVAAAAPAQALSCAYQPHLNATACLVQVGNGNYMWFVRDYDGWSAWFPR